MATSTLTSKGQVTIPKEIRTRLGLQTGDRIEFRVDDQGRIEILPAVEPDHRRYFGMLRHLARERPVTVEEMRQAVHEKAARKYGRGR